MFKVVKVRLLLFVVFVLLVSGCGNNVVDQEASKSEYTNMSFGYKFTIPDGVIVDTQGAVMYPVEHEEAIELGVEFGDKKTAFLSAMREPETFPEIKGRESLSAEEYVQAWWDDNKNDTGPYVIPVLSPIFSKNINNNEWFGFTASEALDSANGAGGGLLDAPKTVMVTKKGDTFYRWQFDADVANDLESILSTFEIYLLK